MSKKLINIRTDKFSKKEIDTIEICLKDWDWNESVSIDYVGGNNTEKLDVVFTLSAEDLGDFIYLIFGCGYEFVYNQ